MSEEQKTYRLTAKGRSALARGARVAVPLEGAQLLGALDRLDDHVADALQNWLLKCEADGLIERVRAPASAESPAGAELDSEVSWADVSLTRLGVYLSHERVGRRAPCRKPVRDTVALVLEDDPDQLALAVRRLSTAGYKVVGAENVKAFYQQLQSTAPDAIFLDVELPDGNGFDVLAALRRHRTYAELPIIMVTVRSAPDDIAKGLRLGADGYITKPYERGALEYVLRYVMKQEIQAA